MLTKESEANGQLVKAQPTGTAFPKKKKDFILQAALLKNGKNFSIVLSVARKDNFELL